MVSYLQDVLMSPLYILTVFLTGLTGYSRFVTLDSIVTAADFIATILFQMPLFPWRIDSPSSSSIPLQTRYLYYAILVLLEYVGYLLTAGQYSDVLFWTISFLGLPIIMTRGITSSLTGPLFERVQKRVFGYLWKQTKRLMCLSFASIVNIICEVTLDMNPSISRKEIADTFVESDYESVSLFLRIFVFTNIVASFETKGLAGNAMKTFLRTLFNAGQVLEVKSHYVDPFPSLTDPGSKLRAVLTSRQLKQFYNPYVLNLLLQLYEQNGDSRITKILKRKLQIFEYLSSRFCTVYTVATVTKHWLISGITSGVVLTYSHNLASEPSGKREFYRDLLLRTIGIGLMYGTSWILIPIMICEYGEYLDNRAVLYMFRALLNKGRKYIRLFLSHRAVLPDILVPAASLAILHLFVTDPWLFSLVAGFGVALSKHRVFAAILVGSGFFSSYAGWHLLAVSILIYVGYCLRDIDEFPEEYIAPDMISSYFYSPSVKIHSQIHPINRREPDPPMEESIPKDEMVIPPPPQRRAPSPPLLSSSALKSSSIPFPARPTRTTRSYSSISSKEILGPQRGKWL